jgi:uncharacterized protein YbjT (DUF2867 family)
MKILVLGGSGVTGRRVIELSLADGHQVVALTRNSSALSLSDPNLELIQGNATVSSEVKKALSGVDAVIHCLGIGGTGTGVATTVVSDSVKVVLNHMRQQGISRIICMSNVGAGQSGTWFYKEVVLQFFLRWLKPIVDDKNEMELALANSSAEWTSVRLPNIVAGARKPIRLSEDGAGIRYSITVDSVAAFLLDQLSDSRWLRKAPSISN